MITVEIESKNKLPALELLASYKDKPIEHLYIRSDKTVTTEVTRLIKDIGSVKKLTVWSPMTRTALRDCFSITGLESLNLFELVTPGKLIDTSKAKQLKAVNYMGSSEIDLRIFSTLPKLTELKAHSSDWSIELLNRMVAKPLKTLELEGCRLTYEMISVIATSTTIVNLDVYSSGLTGRGLAKIAQMRQLESLDIWETKICADDLALLVNLPNINYLSIGGYSAQRCLDMEKAIPYLLKMPNLTSIWIDNILLSDEQLALLKEHIKSVRYDYYDAYDE